MYKLTVYQESFRILGALIIFLFFVVTTIKLGTGMKGMTAVKEFAGFYLTKMCIKFAPDLHYAFVLMLLIKCVPNRI